jgi:hypothetical protein
MDSHPEEFIHGTKWNPYLPNTHHVTKGTLDYFSILNFAERNAIAHKFNKLCLSTMRQNAYNRVLEKMFEEDEAKKWKLGATATSTISLNTNQTNSITAISVGDQTLTANDIKKLKSKTIFGRLFV